MESWSAALGNVMEVPGARYACAADPATGTLLAGLAAPARATSGAATRGFAAPGVSAPGGAAPEPPGRPPGDRHDDVPADLTDAVAAILGWAGAETGRPGFQDAMVTTERTHHLVRALYGTGGPVLLYLLLDRDRGNLAVARRALAAARPGTAERNATGRAGSPGRAPVVVPRAGPAPDEPPVPVPVPVPLPRRASGEAASRAEPRETPEEVPVPPAAPPGGRWADDLRTMARILAALRRTDRSHTTES